MGWPREAEFRELLERCERKASKGLLDELAALAVADDKQVRLNQPLSSQGGSSSGGQQCGVALADNKQVRLSLPASLLKNATSREQNCVVLVAKCPVQQLLCRGTAWCSYGGGQACFF